MIKFFRRIRQQLVSQNKFSKYMLYAIGEIVLVVIGILIALSINNWNQNVANDSKIASIFEQIERELMEDAKTAHNLNNFWERQDSLYTVAMGDSVTIKMYRDFPRLNRFFNGTEQNTIQTDGFELLKLNSNLTEESFSPLMTKMSKMYNYYTQEFENNLKNLSFYNNTYHEKMAEKNDWFHKSRDSDEWLQYLVNSSEHKNNLKVFSRLVGANLNDSRKFMLLAIDILQSIEETQTTQKIKKEAIFSKIIGPITAFKMKPFQENIPRSNFNIGQKEKYYRIFTNETPNPVQFSVLFKDGDERRITESSIETNNKSKPVTVASGESQVFYGIVAGATIKFMNTNEECIGYHVTTDENSVIYIE